MADTGMTLALIKALGGADPAAIKDSVAEWLEDHPEATTTVQDGAVSYAKLDNNLQGAVDDVGDLKSAVDNLENEVNGVYVHNYTAGKKITASNSAYSIDDDENTCVSDLIEITWEWTTATSTYTRFYYNGESGVSAPYRIIYFDENLNYLGYKGTDGTTYRSVPNLSGGKYVRFSFRRGTVGKLMQNASPNTVYWEAADSLEEPGIVHAINDLSAQTEDNTNALQYKIDKDGAGQITIRNCQFMILSPNLFDLTDIETGVLDTGNGDIASSYTNYRTSDWIEVDSSEDYTFSSIANSALYLCWYKSDKTFISGEQSQINTTQTKQSPSNAKYIRFSIPYANINNNIQLEKGSTATPYMAYGFGYLNPEYAPIINEDFVLNLPVKVYALVGTEMNIYFDNLVEGHDTDYEWDVTCSTSSVGMHLERGYRIVASQAGTYTLTFTAKRKADDSVVTKTASLIIAGEDAGSGDSVSVIVLGDSTTDNGIAIGKLHTNFSEDSMDVSTLGTRGTSPNNHEGRSGWRFETYFTKASITYTDGRGTIYNPFYNPTTETFDANYYFTNSGISKPDYFFINLGINDMFGATTDSQLASAIENTIDYCDAMIESVNNATSSTKVCVCLTIPPNYSQDAFGREYKTGQNRNRYKRNNLLWVKRLMEEYEGREDEGIYVIPINLALDTRYNMGFDTQPVNARNTAITYSMPIGNGGVHPVESGYWQIADVYTAFLKANAE